LKEVTDVMIRKIMNSRQTQFYTKELTAITTELISITLVFHMI